MKELNLFKIFILLSILSNMSCKKKTEAPSNDESTKLYRLDIRHIEFLSILPVDPYYATTPFYDPKTFFKVSTDGSFQEIVYLSKNGTPLKMSMLPSSICNLNADYIFVATEYDYQTQTSAYLIRKSDGVLFPIKFDEAIDYFMEWPFGKIDVFQGPNNHIYFSAYSNLVVKIYKVNINNPSNMRGIICSPTNENIENYAVDSRGNILFCSTNGIKYNRIKKANGSIENVNANIAGICVGSDDNFYYEDYKGATIDIIQLKIDNLYNSTYTNLGSYSTSALSSYSNNGTVLGTPYKFLNGTKTVFANINVFEELDPATTVTTYTTPISGIIDISNSTNFIYLSGNSALNQGELLKISKSNYSSYSNIVSPTNYSVYKLASSSNDVVVFSALRLSDGKNVIVRIDNTGTENILKKGVDPQSTVISYVK